MTGPTLLAGMYGLGSVGDITSGIGAHKAATMNAGFLRQQGAAAQSAAARPAASPRAAALRAATSRCAARGAGRVCRHPHGVGGCVRAGSVTATRGRSVGRRRRTCLTPPPPPPEWNGRAGRGSAASRRRRALCLVRERVGLRGLLVSKVLRSWSDPCLISYNL